jgi:hypothetical protein
VMPLRGWRPQAQHNWQALLGSSYPGPLEVGGWVYILCHPVPCMSRRVPADSSTVKKTMRGGATCRQPGGMWDVV